MSGIERLFAGLLLAGAIGGAAAFAHGLAGGPEKTSVAPLVQPAHHADAPATVRISALPGVAVPLQAGPAVATIQHPARHAAPAAPVAARRVHIQPIAAPKPKPVIHTVQAAKPAPVKTRPATHVAPATPAPAPVKPTPAPAPAPAPTPAPAAPTATAPVLTPVAASAPTPPTQPTQPAQPVGNGHGRGKAKGHDKQQEQLAPQLTPVADSVAPVATQVEMAVAPTAPTAGSGDCDPDNGNGHGNHGRGHSDQ